MKTVTLAILILLCSEVQASPRPHRGHNAASAARSVANRQANSARRQRIKYYGGAGSYYTPPTRASRGGSAVTIGGGKSSGIGDEMYRALKKFEWSTRTRSK